MNRAIVIKTYGDKQMLAPVVDTLAARELQTVQNECKRLNALNGVSAYGDSVRWQSVAGAMAVKYSTRRHGRLYGAILGLWGLLWLVVGEWVDYFQRWNREA